MRGVGVLLILLGLLGSGGCGKKERNQSPQSASSPSESNRSLPPVTKPAAAPRPQRFTIRDIDGRETWIEFARHRATFHRIRQPLVAIVLFADWCPPCRGMLPYLSQLQAKNQQDLFVIGVLVHSDLNATGLRRLMRRYDTNFFISQSPDNNALGDYLAKAEDLGANYPLPLTLLYKNGKYLMHIQGAAPYEMLQSLIDQLKEKKKKEP